MKNIMVMAPIPATATPTRRPLVAHHDSAPGQELQHADDQVTQPQARRSPIT